MALKHRLQRLELNLKTKIPGCNPTLFIVVLEGSRNMPFDTGAYRPADDEIGKYLKHLRDGGQCRNCKGSCAIDWAPDGFKNHTLTGERSSLSPEPKIFTMFCADAETPVLMRQLMNGERTR
jgi:hypothetical protein